MRIRYKTSSSLAVFVDATTTSWGVINNLSSPRSVSHADITVLQKGLLIQDDTIAINGINN